MTELLRVEGLRKRIDQRVLLDIDSLVIGEAQAWVLSGPNGAGKSTLLRILSGLETAECSRAVFRGSEVSLSPYPTEMRRSIGYVHQHPAMFSTSVEANIAYGLRAQRKSKQLITESVRHALEWAHLDHLAGRRADKLSGGEKQRIALARVKVLQPKLMLLDEPTSNLDGPAREQILELIPSLIDAGQSVLIATHDRELIGLPDTRRITLREGKLVEM